MQQHNTISIQTLLDRALWSQMDLARESHIDPTTVSRALRGKSVRRLTANKLLQTLNLKLGTAYTLDEVSGLSYRERDAEEDDDL